MGVHQIDVTVELTEFVCGECGGVYAISERFRKQCQDKGNRGWRCPYPDCNTTWGYYGKTEAEKLQDQLDCERQQRERISDQLKQTTRSLNAQRGATTRARNQLNRTKAGICPCCNRTFKQLAAHMKSQHPNWNPKCTST